MRIATTLAGLLLLGCASPSVPTERPEEAAEPGASMTSDAAAAADRVRRVIETELEQDGAPSWAGRYYRGDGTGVNVSLCLAPAAGFHYEWRGCAGVIDRNCGAVQLADGRLQLAASFPNPESGIRLPGEVVPVAWGERRYLLAEEQLGGFVNAVNSGGEPRDSMHGSFLLRNGDDARPVAGQPELPAPWGARLLDQPIVATIAAVTPSPEPTAVPDDPVRAAWAQVYRPPVRVTLAAGSDDGIWQGMRFFVVDSQGTGGQRTRSGSGRVVSVTGDRCVVELDSLWRSEPPVAVGMQLTTRRRRG